MLFSSMTFIFVFLPIVILLHFIMPKKLHNALLLIASLIFYAWGEPRYIPVILLVILVNYFGAIFIENNPNNKKSRLVITILVNLWFLVYFKYFDFIISNINNLIHSNINFINVVMPIGISFYTFQALSYVIDVYRGQCKAQKNIFKLALYICLFPQLVAGPIVKYHDVAEQIESRKITFNDVSIGVKRFIIGLSKKVLIANIMGEIADKIFIQNPHEFSHLVAWLGAFAYSFQLYFDFSGYSDMAIGLGLIFGFKFMENFNYPYISKSITEFWRRWHISLSTWFREYVYISLGGNRCSKLKTLRNLGIVFLLTGIWHGAKWTFVAWGLWHGIFIIIEKIMNIKEIDSKTHAWWITVLRHLYCSIIFITGWVIFRSNNFAYALDYLKNMFGILQLNSNDFTYGITYYIDRLEAYIFLIALSCSVPLFKNILLVKNKWAKLLTNIWLLTIFFLSVISIARNTYNPFIYFRF